MPQSRFGRLLDAFGFGVLSALALSLTLYGLGGWLNRFRTFDWQPIDGTILSLEVSKRTRATDMAPKDAECRVVSCNYTYVIDGCTYSGSRVGFGWFDATSHSRQCRVLKEAYEHEKQVTLWVDPDVPAQSALFLPEPFSEMYLGPAIGLLWFGGVAMLWLKARLDRGNGGTEMNGQTTVFLLFL